MSNTKQFNFRRSRSVNADEVEAARQAIEAKLGTKRASRGRPPKGEHKYRPIFIRLHPLIIAWAKSEAHRRHIGYQTVINETLLRFAA